MKRYILVGGNPFRSYTGTGTYTGLTVVGAADTDAEAALVTNEQFERCGGLLLWIDTQTGAAGEPGGNPDLKF